LTKIPFTAVVLAGDRGPDDPLVKATGAACKALVEIDGQPMLLRVLKTLGDSSYIDHSILSGPKQEHLQTQPALDQQITNKLVEWHPPQSTPSTSAAYILQHVAQQPVLITTADHPLLTPEIVNHFCKGSQAQNLDVAVGLCEYPRIKQAFPGMRKTVLKFSDGEYCGCNLFAFLSDDSRRMADIWRQVENERKNPLRIIRLLGWLSVARYLTGTLSLDSAMKALSKKLGLRIGTVILPYPEAAVDVDSVADQLIVEKKLAGS
jgi:GTP:adenosylcobinamide-phosphate guanylyltransferase